MANPNTSWSDDPAANPSSVYGPGSLAQLANGDPVEICFDPLVICFDPLTIKSSPSWADDPSANPSTSWTRSP